MYVFTHEKKIYIYITHNTNTDTDTHRHSLTKAVISFVLTQSYTEPDTTPPSPLPSLFLQLPLFLLDFHTAVQTLTVYIIMLQL